MPAKFKKGIDLQGQRAIGAADGSAATDLVTLQQLQAAIRGLDWKDAVRLVTSTNHSLSGLADIDGVTPVAGDRIGVIGQTAGAANGIYVAASGAWSRATDADVSAEVTAGMAFTVTEGTNKGSSIAQPNSISYVLITNNPIVLGTTALVFSPLGGASAPYTAGVGLDLSGNQFFVKVPGSSGLIVDGTGVRIDPSIVARIYQADCAATINPQTFTHGLGKRPTVSIVDTSGEVVYADLTVTTTDITVDWGSAPSAGDYRVVAVG